MKIFKIGDTVKIIKISDDEQKEYLGHTGKIVDIDREWEYPYLIEFHDRELQTKNTRSGTWLWKGYQLEVV